MGNLEVALNVAPYADYMVASAETESTSGWFYEWMSVFGEAYEERGNLLTAAEPECHLADCDKIPEWGRSAAHWAVANGIIYGNNGSILPDDYVKTTEAVAMISRLGKSTEE